VQFDIPSFLPFFLSFFLLFFLPFFLPSFLLFHFPSHSLSYVVHNQLLNLNNSRQEGRQRTFLKGAAVAFLRAQSKRRLECEKNNNHVRKLADVARALQALDRGNSLDFVDNLGKRKKGKQKISVLLCLIFVVHVVSIVTENEASSPPLAFPARRRSCQMSRCRGKGRKTSLACRTCSKPMCAQCKVVIRKFVFCSECKSK